MSHGKFEWPPLRKAQQADAGCISVKLRNVSSVCRGLSGRNVGLYNGHSLEGPLGFITATETCGLPGRNVGLYNGHRNLFFFFSGRNVGLYNGHRDLCFFLEGMLDFITATEILVVFSGGILGFITAIEILVFFFPSRGNVGLYNGHRNL